MTEQFMTNLPLTQEAFEQFLSTEMRSNPTIAACYQRWQSKAVTWEQMLYMMISVLSKENHAIKTAHLELLDRMPPAPIPNDSAPYGLGLAHSAFPSWKAMQNDFRDGETE